MNTVESLPEDWTVPEPLFALLGRSLEKQRCLKKEGHLLIVLHEPPKEDAMEREGFLLWRNPEGDVRALDNPDGHLRVMDTLSRYEKRLEVLGDQIDRHPDARTLFHIQKTLQPISRALRNFYNTLHVAVEAHPGDPVLTSLSDHALKLDRESDFITTEAKAALDFIMAEEAEAQSEANLEMTRAAHRLNRIVALFLPMTALASLFGMNLVSGLESTPPWLFWLVFFGGITLGWVMRQVVIDQRKIPDPLKLRLGLKKVTGLKD